MDGTFEDKSNGYNCDNSNDPTSESTFKRVFFYSMSESTNEDENGEQ